MVRKQMLWKRIKGVESVASSRIKCNQLITFLFLKTVSTTQFNLNPNGLLFSKMKRTLPIQNRVPPIIIALLSIVALSIPGNAQVRTVTQLPYPSKANSIAWIANISYIPGAGLQQQLDFYLPTNQKNMPLIVYVHGGGYGHGDKFGDSLNPNELQLLWDGYAMASINYRLTPRQFGQLRSRTVKPRSAGSRQTPSNIVMIESYRRDRRVGGRPVGGHAWNHERKQEV
jgi:hypothetical protein